MKATSSHRFVEWITIAGVSLSWVAFIALTVVMVWQTSSLHERKMKLIEDIANQRNELWRANLSRRVNCRCETSHMCESCREWYENSGDK